MTAEPPCHERKPEWTRVDVNGRSWRVKLHHSCDDVWHALAIGETYIEEMARGATRDEVLDSLRYRLAALPAR